MQIQGDQRIPSGAAFTRTELLAVTVVILSIAFIWAPKNDAGARA